MLKRFLVAIALTTTTVLLYDRAPNETAIVILAPDANVELPIAGVEIVQGDRKQTYWFYSDPSTQTVSNDCVPSQRRFLGS